VVVGGDSGHHLLDDTRVIILTCLFFLCLEVKHSSLSILYIHFINGASDSPNF
jgi:hypothetical protein